MGRGDKLTTEYPTMVKRLTTLPTAKQPISVCVSRGYRWRIHKTAATIAASRALSITPASAAIPAGMVKSATTVLPRV